MPMVAPSRVFVSPGRGALAAIRRSSRGNGSPSQECAQWSGGPVCSPSCAVTVEIGADVGAGTGVVAASSTPGCVDVVPESNLGGQGIPQRRERYNRGCLDRSHDE